MANSFYDDMLGVSVGLFNYFGVQATLWAHNGDEEFKKGTVTVVSMSDEKATKAGFTIGGNNRAFYISPVSKLKPEPGDWIQFDKRKYTFKEVKHLQPDLKTDMFYYVSAS